MIRPEFERRFLEEAGTGGALSFDRFMRLALLDPEVGYYAAKRRRVGRERGTDFYTASSLGSVFGRLVVACAAERLESAGWGAEEAVFVELGVEPGGGVLKGVEHPFAGAVGIGLDEAGGLAERLGELGPRGPLVVFSNELFDAQPVERWVREAGIWRQAGVRFAVDGRVLEWCRMDTPEPSWMRMDPVLQEQPEGWVLDAPTGAVELARNLTGAGWAGVFIAFDYGMSWAALARERPEGTLRAYRNHRLERELLSEPGERDLTAHVCWDWLERELLEGGFQAVHLESQEAFLVKRAAPELERMVKAAAGMSAQRELRTLQELLHPGKMGQKFQVLSGWRAARQG